MASDDDIIVPPSWLVPEAPATEPTPADASPVDAADVISLPPGIADSATFRLSAERVRAATPPAKPDVVFFPSAPGAPPAPAAPAAPPAPAAPAAALADESVANETVADETITGATLTEAAVTAALATDETVHVSRPTRSWRLVFPGSPPVVVGGPLYVGRNPSALEQHGGAALLPVDDPLKSVSKTHALLELDAGGLWLTDLHSTNGSSVVGTDGVRVLLDAGARSAVEPGSTIELGDFAIQVEHG